jgi:hypothetical protein
MSNPLIEENGELREMTDEEAETQKAIFDAAVPLPE